MEESSSRLLDFLQQNPALMNPASERARLDRLVVQTESKQQTITDLLEQLAQQQLSTVEGEVGALTEPGVVRASHRLDSLMLERAELAARYGSQHLKMSGHEARVQEASTLLRAQIDAYTVRLSLRIEDYEKQLVQVNGILEKVSRDIDRLVDNQLTLKGLELKKESAVKKYEGMTEEMKVELVADAVPPRNTFGFNQLMLLGLVFLMSFMLMVSIMVVRSMRGK